MLFNQRPITAKTERIFLAALFILFGSLIIIVFSPWRPLLEPVYDYLGRGILLFLLVMALIIVRKNKQLAKYGTLLFAFNLFLAVVSLDWIINIYLLEYVGLDNSTPAGWALQKINESLLVISLIVIFTRLSGHGLDTIYIQRGNLKAGLGIGLTLFFIAAAGSVPMATLFNAQDLTMARIIPWIPWLILFVLANAAMEEIMFRGLFLRKLEPFFGPLLANFMVALVFTLMHRAVTYTADQYLFLGVLFPLAIAWGYIMQKTEAVWGSILFHAGMDIPIMLGIFSNL